MKRLRIIIVCLVFALVLPAISACTGIQGEAIYGYLGESLWATSGESLWTSGGESLHGSGIASHSYNTSPLENGSTESGLYGTYEYFESESFFGFTYSVKVTITFSGNTATVRYDENDDGNISTESESGTFRVIRASVEGDAMDVVLIDIGGDEGAFALYTNRLEALYEYDGEYYYEGMSLTKK